MNAKLEAAVAYLSQQQPPKCSITELAVAAGIDLEAAWSDHEVKELQQALADDTRVMVDGEVYWLATPGIVWRDSLPPAIEVALRGLTEAIAAHLAGPDTHPSEDYTVVVIPHSAMHRCRASERGALAAVVQSGDAVDLARRARMKR